MHTITPDALVAVLDDPGKVVVLDVREPSEFEQWRIPGSLNVPLGELEARLDEVPTGREIVTVCAVGARASKAAESLGAKGFDVAVLEGGMSGWASVYDDVEDHVGAATVVQVRRRGKGCLSYLIGAGSTAVAIDPSADIEQYLHRAAARGWTLTHVFDTHLHADHVSGARALAASTGAALVLNPADRFEFEFQPLSDGMEVHVGDGVSITVVTIPTPGHTMGSTCYLLGESAIFTGDTLFLESVGRPDLADRAEEFARELYASLHDRVLSLPDDVVVYPAHYGDVVEVHAGASVSAPLGVLADSLWQLRCEEDEFVAWTLASVKDRPPNYAAIVRANQGEGELDAAERRGLEEGPNRCAVAG